MKQYKISIITVTKNSQKYLKKNIESVISQNYQNYEHIIIDGNSKDNTLNIVKKYRDKIKFIKNKNDKGLYHAMNVGLEIAKGDIIGILNSDDFYYKNCLKYVNKYFNDYQNIDFLFGSVLKYKLLHGYRPWKIKFSFGFYSTHSVGFFIKQKAQKKIGKYNLKYKYSADYDLFLRMINKHKLKGMATKKNEIFGKFRKGGLSSRIKFIDYLKEGNQIRIDNGQNKIFVYSVFILRCLRNLHKLIK